MSSEVALLFLLTVLPLICTPGPDILLVASQGAVAGPQAALRAVAGLLLGYTLHGVLSALGVAALVATSPGFYLGLKWSGIIYLGLLALLMLRSAWLCRPGPVAHASAPVSIWRGFLTSFLNPKGLLMYLALLPQFIQPDSSAALQALLLSLLFITGCALVYSTVGLLAARLSVQGVAERTRRVVEAVAGTLLAAAAVRMALQ